MTLTEFLKARLDEDEQTAREAGNRRWLVEGNTISLWPEDEHDGFMTWPTRADARHAYRWQPERVLAEVEAKRRLIAEVWDYDEGFPTEHTPGNTAEAVLKLLALPYADHPDYNPAWRP